MGRTSAAASPALSEGITEDMLASLRYENMYNALREGVEAQERAFAKTISGQERVATVKLPPLNEFARGCTATGAWKAALTDPVSAACMRHLRRRVQQLEDPMTCVVPSEWAYREMNNRAGAPKGPRHAQQQTSRVRRLQPLWSRRPPVAPRHAILGRTCNTHTKAAPLSRAPLAPPCCPAAAGARTHVAPLASDARAPVLPPCRASRRRRTP